MASMLLGSGESGNSGSGGRARCRSGDREQRAAQIQWPGAPRIPDPVTRRSAQPGSGHHRRRRWPPGRGGEHQKRRGGAVAVLLDSWTLAERMGTSSNGIGNQESEVMLHGNQKNKVIAPGNNKME
ncbi:hypothetical protein GUJ93_ZPchr0012g21445 [Zizania palustris]|uniref:Uncharacterized protein n=1 Tax=Zizania palustris TaxID=103762 RepID=A0A8J5WN15_ZIZPA|nr:hypothetical protein GUJ93_ZPchr0012g21445 [Zizania palustris]